MRHPHRRSPLVVLVVAGALATTVLLGAPEGAVAAPDADDAMAATQVLALDSGELSFDELTDLQRMAHEDGTSLDEAVTAYAWQNDFALLATAIEEQYPDEFAGARIEDAAGHRASISFKDEVPDGAARQTAGFRQADVEAKVGLGHSSRQMDERIATVHKAVAAQKDLVNAVVSTYDESTGAVTVEVRPTDRTISYDAIRSEALKRTLSASIPAKTRDYPVLIVVDESLSVTDMSAYGGGRTEQIGKSSLDCTGGFTATTDTALTGVVTAGHCGNSTTYENQVGEYEQGMTFKLQHRGTYGDVQFHTASTTEKDDFYYDFGRLRDVAAVANPVDNQYICRFGQKTGAHCSHVYDLSVCVYYDGYDECRLVRMDNNQADHGDSGGPWYYGGTAYGIHKGSIGSVIGTDDVWSRVTYLEEALGVTVMR